LRPGEAFIVVVALLIMLARLQTAALSLGRVSTGVAKHQSVEFNARCTGESKRGAKELAAETKNGDSPGCISSNPSPERFDETLCEESPLEKSIAGPEK
jgi:hypothetical protein